VVRISCRFHYLAAVGLWLFQLELLETKAFVVAVQKKKKRCYCLRPIIPKQMTEEIPEWMKNAAEGDCSVVAAAAAEKMLKDEPSYFLR